MDFENKVIRFESIDSTNRFLADLALGGEEEGVVCVSEFQTSGKGRNARHWESPPGGGLLCSILFRPIFDPQYLYLVPIIVLLSVLDALRDTTGVQALIKWPNDIIYDGSKLGGMLSEIVKDELNKPTEVAPALVVGFGINCFWPEGFAINTDPTIGIINNIVPITIEEITGAKADKDDLLRHILRNVQSRYASLTKKAMSFQAELNQDQLSPYGNEFEDSIAAVIAEYRLRCDTIGKAVQVQFHDKIINGYAKDITFDGRLIVDDIGELVIVTAGDVIHLRSME